MISLPPDAAEQNSLLQTVLNNNAFEARRRRGRAEQPKSLDITILSGSRLSRHLSLREGDTDLGLEGESKLFAAQNASDLRRNHHIRRKRQFYGPRMQPFPSHSQVKSPVIVSAPAALTPIIQPLPSVPPLRVTPKISTQRFSHARSYSAPAMTPVASPDSILCFYAVSPTEDGSETDSDNESICSAPPSTTEQISMNMFLARGDSIDSWPTEFPVEALDEEEKDEHRLFLAGEPRKTGDPGSKRQSTEAIVKLLRARRRRADVSSVISQTSIIPERSQYF